jgi:hypothetical protein
LPDEKITATGQCLFYLIVDFWLSRHPRPV